MTLTRSEREEMLRKIDGAVRQKYYDRNFNGHDWKRLVELHAQFIVNADSDAAFEGAVSDLLNEVGSSALGLLGPNTPITARSSINASFRAVPTAADGERWALQDVLPGGVAERAGLKPGDVLLDIAGKAISPPDKVAFEMNRRTDITVSRAGQRRTAQIDLTTQKPKYRDNPYSEPRSVAGALVERTIGNLKVSLFPGLIGIDFANEVTTAIDGTLRDADRLLIDLRGNPGGGIGGLRLMSYLTPRKQPIGFSLDRPTAERGYTKETLPRLDHIPRSKLEIPWLAFRFMGKKSVALETEGLGDRPFHRKIVILANEHSTGAAEMVIQFAQENRLATVVGSKTPGRLVSRSGIKLGKGYTLVVPVAAYMSWNGTQIEGKGISPDVPIDWSLEAALEGRDLPLERAVETLRSM